MAAGERYICDSRDCALTPGTGHCPAPPLPGTPGCEAGKGSIHHRLDIQRQAREGGHHP